MAPEPDPLLDRARARVGESLRGKWKLERLLGVGGMAAVFAATHRNGLRGAVKILHTELNTVEDVKKRFQREGYVANKVGHAGAVRVLDDDVADDGSVFLVMELLEGLTVDALAASRPGRRLSAGEVLAIGDLALDVLAAAHDKGIIHRDLKPENLFMTSAAELRVLDFGIARLREGGQVHREGSFGTRVGATLGTPAFMSPEQASGRWSEVDARADVWALGATLFTLFAGRRVHEEATPLLILAASVTKPAPSLATIAPDAPPALVELIDRSLSFTREGRWQSAREMQASLRAARVEHPFTFTPSDIAEGDALVNENSTVPFGPASRPPRPDAASAIAKLELDTRSALLAAPPTLSSKAHPGIPVTRESALPVIADEPTTLRRGQATLVAAPPVDPTRWAPGTRRVIAGAIVAALVVLGTSVWLASRSGDEPSPRRGPSESPR